MKGCPNVCLITAAMCNMEHSGIDALQQGIEHRRSLRKSRDCFDCICKTTLLCTSNMLKWLVNACSHCKFSVKIQEMQSIFLQVIRVLSYELKQGFT